MVTSMIGPLIIHRLVRYECVCVYVCVCVYYVSQVLVYVWDLKDVRLAHIILRIFDSNHKKNNQNDKANRSLRISYK